MVKHCPGLEADVAEQCPRVVCQRQERLARVDTRPARGQERAERLHASIDAPVTQGMGL